MLNGEGTVVRDRKIAGSIPDPGSQTALLGEGHVAMGVP